MGAALGLLKDFTGWTSAHGLPQIGAARNWTVRIVWILLFCAAFSIFWWQFYGILDQYFSYPVTVAQTIITGERDFPAVTLCPSTSIIYNADSNTYPTSSNINTILAEYEDWVAQHPAAGTVDNGYRFNEKNEKMSEYHVWLRRLLVADTIDKDKTTLMNQDFTWNIDGTTNSALVECLFAGVSCSADNFTLVRDPFYTFCWTFNNYADPKQRAKVTRPGTEHGLTITLSSPQNETTSGVNVNAWRVVVHEQNTEPFPESFGMYAPSGLSTQFAVRMTKMTSLDQPYGECSMAKTGSESESSWYYAKSRKYSQEGCFRSCLQDAVVAKCGCADPYLGCGPYSEDTMVQTVSDCGATQWCSHIREGSNRSVCIAVTCAWNAEHEVSPMNECNCPVACERISFTLMTSQAVLPSLRYAMGNCILKATNETLRDQVPACIEGQQRPNHVGIRIYFDTATYETLVESAAFTLTDIIYALGGQIGLWLGFSVITCIEFVGLAILIIMVFCQRVAGPSGLSSEERHKGDIDFISDKLHINAAIDTDDECTKMSDDECPAPSGNDNAPERPETSALYNGGETASQTAEPPVVA